MSILKVSLVSLCIVISYGYVIKQDLCTVYNTHSNTIDVIQVNGSNGIELGAFDNCHHLTKVHIYGSLDEIDPKIFRYNQKLEEISFADAGLHKIHGETFATLNNLKSLNMTNNALTDFPVYEFPVLPSLEEIYLDNNFLSDLDVEEMFDKFPSLKLISYYNNSIECDRGKVIQETLTSRNITNTLHCIREAEIDKIFSDSSLSSIRGRLDNTHIKGEVKHLKEVNRELQQNMTKVDEKVDGVLVSVAEMQQQVTHYSHQILEVGNYFKGELPKERANAKRTNFMVVATALFTLALVIVVGIVVKCFITMRHDLQTLKRQDEEKYNELKEQLLRKDKGIK